MLFHSTEGLCLPRRIQVTEGQQCSPSHLDMASTVGTLHGHICEDMGRSGWR